MAQNNTNRDDYDQVLDRYFADKPTLTWEEYLALDEDDEQAEDAEGDRLFQLMARLTIAQAEIDAINAEIDAIERSRQRAQRPVLTLVRGGLA